MAIVTGAGSGIGRAIARRLDAMGWSGALAGRRVEPLQETASSLRGEWIVVATDVRDHAQCANLIDATGARFGRIDALVNNAGALASGAIEAHDAKAIADVFATNAIGPATLIALAWPVFRAQRAGAVVNISSLAARERHSRPLAYAASKAALDAMTRACAAEGRAIGVRAWSIQPGFVETAMLRGFADESRVPPSHAAPPEAVADMVARCLSGAPDCPSGAALLVERAESPWWRRAARRERERVRRWVMGRW